MHLRYRILLPLLALCTALAVPAFAAKPAPIQTATPDNTPVYVNLGNIENTQHVCQLGILPPAANAFGYILPPDDEYYTLLGTCAECNYNYVVTAAHVQLFFTEACQAPVFVGVVGADLSDPNCPRPNPFDIVCPEVGYVLSSGGVLNDCIDFSLPLDCASMCSRNPAGPVFLKFRFEQGSCPQARPAFCGPPSCQNCRQYNIYPGAPPGGDDLCAVLSPFSLYGVIMYADVSCCPTPTLPGSWGHLKTLYR